MDGLEVRADAGGSQLEQHAGEGGAAWPAVEPEDDRVVLRVVTGLEEPVEEVLGVLVVEVAGPLLDGVDAELGRVDGPHTEGVGRILLVLEHRDAVGTQVLLGLASGGLEQVAGGLGGLEGREAGEVAPERPAVGGGSASEQSSAR